MNVSFCNFYFVSDSLNNYDYLSETKVVDIESSETFGHSVSILEDSLLTNRLP